MDQAVLVKSDRDIGAKVMNALNRLRVPVRFIDWNYVPQLNEWQLVIATPWFDTKGPRTTYRALVDALTNSDVEEDVPMRRIFLRSPTDPLVRELEQEVKDKDEGFLHILRNAGNDPSDYSVLFAPTAGNLGFVRARKFAGIREVTDFLSDGLGLKRSAISDALDEVHHSGAGSIFPVTLTARQIKKLGFA